jgi:3D (Asp-Asp-Asp) domain-containing protein
MKRLVATIGLALLLVSTLEAREQSLLARVTVYWASGGRGSDHYTRQHKCATGTRLRCGHCAVDPRKIPYGSQIIFPDRTSLLAVDTGSAVRNRKAARLAGRTVNERSAIVVDRFFETKQQALSWARRNPAFMPIRVMAPGYGSPSSVSQIAPTKLASNDNVSRPQTVKYTNLWSVGYRRSTADTPDRISN